MHVLNRALCGVLVLACQAAEDPQALLERARAAIAAGKPEDAIGPLLEAVRLQPGDAAGHALLGRLLLASAVDKGREAGAREMQEAIRLDPARREYPVEFGRWLVDQHQFERAITVLRNGIQSGGASLDACLLLGLAQLESQGSESAFPAIRQALELDPHSAAAHHLLGSAYFGECRLRARRGRAAQSGRDRSR